MIWCGCQCRIMIRLVAERCSGWTIMCAARSTNWNRVWHIIQGTYRFWNEPEIGTATDKESETTEGETPAPAPLPYTDIRFTTYLLATDEDGDTLAEYDAKQFYAFAWVENEDIPELSEYGTVIIERCNGGLWRVG